MITSSVRVSTFMLLTALLIVPFLVPISRAAVQTSFTTIVSYYVTGSPNYKAPGNESFWNGLPWTSVSLVASLAPGGGHTSNVLVRSANDGFNVYILFRWNDTQGPSFGSSSEIYRNSTTGQLLPLDPAHTNKVTQLFYNSTYYYPDRAAILWYIGQSSQRDQAPVMLTGTNGALSSGTADIWHWQSNPTDNNPSDTGFPGGYTNPKGRPIYPPNNVSFAEDDYTNSTGFFPIAGNVTGTLNLDPYANPYLVQAGTYFSTANKTWTLEMVRSFSISEDAKFRVQLSTGSSYFVGFAVWNGKLGESSHLKSVSKWYNLTMTDQAVSLPNTPAPASGISPTLAISAGAGLLITGLIIGLILGPRTRQRKM